MRSNRLTNPDVFSLRDVAFSYPGEHIALKGVDLEIRAQESVVIVGANGCGKSTLLKLLDGLHFPRQGTIAAFGKPLTERALQDEEANLAFRRRVGLIFQDPDVQLFLPAVFDELAFAPLQLGLAVEEVRRRVEMALRSLRIEPLRDRAPHQLSGGEKRRVAIASLLTLDPDVWLMDEPSAGLDPRSHSWLIEFVRAQHGLGKTMIVATHDLSLAEEIATVVHVFAEDHRIVASGSPRQILQDHDLLHRCNLYHYHTPVARHGAQ